VEVRRRDFWKANLSEANVIFCYLFPDVMQNLSDKLIVELNPGTVVASCNFALPGWQAVRVVRPGSAFHNDPIYIYRFDKTYMNSVQPSPEPYV
jgi:hypothetical protein